MRESRREYVLRLYGDDNLGITFSLVVFNAAIVIDTGIYGLFEGPINQGYPNQLARYVWVSIAPDEHVFEVVRTILQDFEGLWE